MTGTSVPPRAVAFLAAGVIGVALAVVGQPLGVDGMRTALGAIAVVPILIGAYDRWLWRWLPVGPPNLRGTWRCLIRPVAGDAGVGGEIEAFIVVRQTARSLHASLFTRESTSHSITSAVEQRPEGWAVSWLYQNESRPGFRQVSPIHFGGVRLGAFGGRSPSRLSGNYWTDRRSGGELQLTTRVSRDILSSFEEGCAAATDCGQLRADVSL